MNGISLYNVNEFMHNVKDFFFFLYSIDMSDEMAYIFRIPQPQPCIYVVIILTVFYIWNKRRFESFILSMGRM